MVQTGNLVYDPMLLWDASIGFVPNGEGAVSPAYAVFKINEAESPSFWNEVLQSHYLRHMYKVISRGTNQRRRKAMPNDFLSVTVTLPQDPEERQSIGDIAQLLETEITHLESLAEQLREQKRGLMQRLFSGELDLSKLGSTTRQEASA